MILFILLRSLINLPSSGIGLHTIKHLAAHGAKVYFTARSKAKADHTIDTIIAEVPTISKDHVVWIQLELSDIPSILKAVEVITAREEKLHILGKEFRILGNKSVPETDQVQ